MFVTFSLLVILKENLFLYGLWLNTLWIGHEVLERVARGNGGGGMTSCE